MAWAPAVGGRGAGGRHRRFADPVRSLEPAGFFNKSVIFGPQLSRALLATHLNGERLTVDHGYPLRLIAPNRASVFNTKWLATIEVLS